MLIASLRCLRIPIAIPHCVRAHHFCQQWIRRQLCAQSKSPTLMNSLLMDTQQIESLCYQGRLDVAVDTALKMAMEAQSMGQQSFPVPSDKVYMCLLKSCMKAKALSHVKRLHVHLTQNQMSRITGTLGNYLVVALAKCGALVDACQLLHSLPHRNAHSWSAVISGYADINRGQDALGVFSLMQNDGVEPDHYTYIALFKACGSIPDLETGTILHDRARKKGFTSICIVGNTLIRMYGKCGNVVEAEKVFEELVVRDVVSWNAMLSVYVEHGHDDKVLRLFRQSQEEGVEPDLITFTSALQACGSLAKNHEINKMLYLEIGQAVHANARRKGVGSDVYVSSTLQSVYGKCGSIYQAEHVFSCLSRRNIVTWNSMLSAYVEEGEGVKALQLFRHMLEQGESPNRQTFVIALQACGILAEKEEELILEAQPSKSNSLRIGHALHVDVSQLEGSDSDIFVQNSLVSMYGRCKCLAQAESVFSSSHKSDIITWNAMLSAYVDQGQGENALRLYRQLKEEFEHLNSYLTFVIVLQGCGVLAEREAEAVPGVLSKIAILEIVRGLHVDAIRQGFVSHVFVSNTLVSVYGKCGNIKESEHVFGLMLERNIISWNAMLSAYVDQSEGSKALKLFTEMQKVGETTNNLTVVLLVQACAILMEKEENFNYEVPLAIAMELHTLVKEKGISSDVCIGSTLISMYGKCGMTEEAKDIFNQMPLNNVVPWNAMLSAYIEQDRGDKVLDLYKKMEKILTVTDITLLSALQACGRTGSLEVCENLHFNIVSTGYDLTPSIANTLIYAYRSCAKIIDALVIFDGLPQHPTVSWNACIAGHAHEGNCRSSIEIFAKLEMTSKEPDNITFLSLLTAYSHAGLVDKGLEYFESLRRDYHVSPDLKHYAILIDLFGRAGNLRVVEDIVQNMQMPANLSIWLCILSACRTHGHIEFGKLAFENALKLHPFDAAPYVLMSNIYCDAGLQDCIDDAKTLSFIESAVTLNAEGLLDVLQGPDFVHWQ